MAGGGACSADARAAKLEHARHTTAIRAMLAEVMVRRLTVLQNQDTDDAAAARRPRWHWVLIGSGFVITLFLPLSLLGVWLGTWLSHAAARVDNAAAQIVLGALPVALSFLIACAAAGALIGRFGGRAKTREAALSGSLGALLGWGLAVLGGSLTPWLVAVASLLVLVLLGAGAASLGARISLARRV